MRQIFVSYRREDAEGEAGHLSGDLARHFGKDSVFLDVDKIPKGRDFRKAIEDNVAICAVLLAVIGKGWIDAKDEGGHRRLDDPSDFLRLEIASALKREIPVIPVLVRGAKMPRPEQLPEDLKELAYRNGVELTHARWRYDLQSLIEALRPYVSERPWWKMRAAILTFVLATAVALVAGAYWLWPRQPTVPDLTGSTLSDAASKLEAASLVMGSKTYQQDAEKSPGTVLSQSPSPNTRVRSGTAVDLVLVQQPPASQAQSQPSPGTSKPVRIPNKSSQASKVQQSQPGREADDATVKAENSASTVPVKKEEAIPLPKVINFCDANCITFRLIDGRYIGINSTGGTPPGWSETLTVVNFTRDSVILTRTLTGKIHFTVTYQGQIAPDGQSVINARNPFCCGQGQPEFARFTFAPLESLPQP